MPLWVLMEGSVDPAPLWQSLLPRLVELWGSLAPTCPLRAVPFTLDAAGRPVPALDAVGAVLVMQPEGADADRLLRTLGTLDQQPALRAGATADGVPLPRLLVWQGRADPQRQALLTEDGWQVQPLDTPPEPGAGTAALALPVLARGLAEALERHLRRRAAPAATGETPTMSGRDAGDVKPPGFQP